MKLIKLCESSLGSKEIFYRGTNNPDIFNLNDNNGIHFSRDYNHAKSFGNYIITAYLNFKNPAPLSVWRETLDKSYGGNPRGMAISMLKQQGYDAMDNPNYETIVFSQKQIQVINIENSRKINELQEPISHYKKILKAAKWPGPETLIKFLELRGYELLGDGAFSDVYAKPGEKFVLKIVHRDTSEDCYLKYINVIKNQRNPHFPKIGRIREYKTAKGDLWYIIPVEHLEKISRGELNSITGGTYAIDFEKYYRGHSLNQEDIEYAQRMRTEQPQLHNALMLIHNTFTGKCDMDLSRRNMMLRGSTLVLTDPLGYMSEK
jgi:hypothetical protein